MRYLSGALVFAFASALSAQTIEGIVINSVTKTGIAGARVTCRAMYSLASANKSANDPPVESESPPRIQSFEATTDIDGRFRFTGLGNGKYSVLTQLEGYGTALALDQPPIEIHAGDGPAKMNIELVPQATISGRVIDNKGHPVAGARVVFVPATGSREERIEISPRGLTTYTTGPASRSTVCDNDGNYKIYISDQGNYTVKAVAPWEMQPPDPEGDREFAWGPTFYPGLTTPEGAGTIAIYPGAKIADVNIKLMPVAMHHVRGIVIDENGDPAPQTEITFQSQSAVGPKQISTDKDGKFDCVLPDGSWGLSAQKVTDEGYWRADDTVVISGRDVDKLKFQIMPSFSIEGVVHLEPALPAGTENQSMVVSMRSWSYLPSRTGRTDDEGRFIIDSVLPGLYVFESHTLPEYKDPPTGSWKYYLASILFGGREVLGSEPVRIVAPGKLEFTYRRGGGRLTGIVEGCAQGIVVLAPVLLRPGSPSNPATCDPKGRYQFTGLRPGEYDVIAFSAADLGRSISPSALESKMSHVTIREGETTARDLEVWNAGK